ncbi:MAG: glycosyltransferase family 4 protein [Woeseia sp.]|nr:glycosyltransferase family 4 protein [Woeseia sp.]NNE62089.1 glycosyltransferase family 4 protein [Woeseia sp.]NNL55422.1 glycosyltransferase family 4 protein [Woeseia sp.]
MTIKVLCIVDDSDRPTVESFIGMHKAGIGVTVSCQSASPNFHFLAEAGVPTVELPLRKNIDLNGIRLLRAEFARGNYDIVHTFNNKAISNVILAARGRNIKIVAYRGIVGAVSFLDPMSWMRYLNPRIDRIICVCEAIRQHFLHMKPAFLRMPPERPVTIHKGHRLEWYDQQPASLSTIGIPDDAFVISCVANYRPRKGVEVLVDAMSHLPADMPAHLVLVGNMSASKLDKQIAASPARDRIHRPGYRKDAPRISAASDVFCLASTKREGLPRSVIEAMAYRVPAVVTNSGGSPELVVDGECGYVVPVFDAKALATAFEKLYRDPQLKARMGQAARDRIGIHFRNEVTVEKTIALYRELVAETPSGAADIPQP